MIQSLIEEWYFEIVALLFHFCSYIFPLCFVLIHFISNTLEIDEWNQRFLIRYIHVACIYIYIYFILIATVWARKQTRMNRKQNENKNALVLPWRFVRVSFSFCFRFILVLFPFSHGCNRNRIDTPIPLNNHSTTLDRKLLIDSYCKYVLVARTNELVKRTSKSHSPEWGPSWGWAWHRRGWGC